MTYLRVFVLQKKNKINEIFLNPNHPKFWSLSVSIHFTIFVLLFLCPHKKNVSRLQVRLILWGWAEVSEKLIATFEKKKIIKAKGSFSKWDLIAAIILPSMAWPFLLQLFYFKRFHPHPTRIGLYTDLSRHIQVLWSLMITINPSVNHQKGSSNGNGEIQYSI